MMKSCSLNRTLLQLCLLLLLAACQARRPPPVDLSSSQEAGEVPGAHLRMLSLGLAHLLQGVEENALKLEQQGEQVAAELDGATKRVESLHKQSLQAGRTHRQVRKDVQVLSARGDRLWRAVRDLQKGLEDLKTEQGAAQRRMNRILQRIKSLSEPRRSEGPSQPGISSLKVVLDSQARQLAGLTSEVSAREKLIDRRQLDIEHLEKQVSETLLAAPRADSDSDAV